MNSVSIRARQRSTGSAYEGGSSKKRIVLGVASPACSAGYDAGLFAHVNTAESFHAIIRRQMYGAHHAVSEQHLQRYINEIVFKWNNRIALGVDGTKRTENAIKGTEGKRLLYRRTDQEAGA